MSYRMRPESVALLVAVLLLIGVERLSPEIVASTFGLACLLVVSLRWNIRPIALGGLVVAGIALRLQPFGVESDVLTTTRAAIDLVVAGGNPYGHGFAASSPPGAPFPYGPLELLWYAVLPANVELLASIAVLAILAAGRRCLGLAIYATLWPFYALASDGANDVSAGLLILLAILVAERRPVVGGVLIGLVSSFKLYALAWAVPLVAFGGLASAGGLVAGLVLGWGPAVVLWGFGPIAWSILDSEQMAAKAKPWYSVPWIFGLQDAEPWRWLSVVLGAVTAGLTFRLPRSRSAFVLGGAAIFLVVLYTGWWSSTTYLVGLAPILCWHLDDWLARSGRHDPVGDPEVEQQPVARLAAAPAADALDLGIEREQALEGAIELG
jgi:hypothetical protein